VGARLPQLSDVELEIVTQLLSYFVRNRHAVDSLEGLTRWRLLEEQIHRSLQRTEAALRWLVSRGFLEEVKLTGSIPLFRLDASHVDDALKFLTEQNAAPQKKKWTRELRSKQPR
jgi:hypothetical protein